MFMTSVSPLSLKARSEGANLEAADVDRARAAGPGRLGLTPLGLARTALEPQTQRLRPEGFCLSTLSEESRLGAFVG
jgi:hypothetical protein